VASDGAAGGEGSGTVAGEAAVTPDTDLAAGAAASAAMMARRRSASVGRGASGREGGRARCGAKTRERERGWMAMRESSVDEPQRTATGWRTGGGT